MRILAVSYEFLPGLTPRSLQVSCLFKYLTRLGCQVDVLTADNIDSITTHKDKAEYDRLACTKGLKIFPVNAPKPTLVSRVINRLATRINLKWEKNAIAKGMELLKADNYDVIVSFAYPVSSHYVGMKLKNISRLPWMAHFADPWSDNPYIKVHGCLHRKFLSTLERKIVQKTDMIVFVSEETRKLAARKYPKQWLSKLFVLPHCYDPEQFNNLPAGNKVPAGNSQIPVVFSSVGNFYGPRTAWPIINCLKMIRQKSPEFLNKLIVRIVGEVRDKKQLHELWCFSDSVELTGFVDHSKSLEYMASSDYLLLVDASWGNSSSIFLPGKLVEYIGSQSPVIGITPFEGCSAKVVRKLGYPVISPQDTEGLYQLMLEILSGSLHFKRNNDFAHSFEASSIAAKFLSILNNNIT